MLLASAAWPSAAVLGLGPSLAKTPNAAAACKKMANVFKDRQRQPRTWGAT